MICAKDKKGPGRGVPAAIVNNDDLIGEVGAKLVSSMPQIPVDAAGTALKASHRQGLQTRKAVGQPCISSKTLSESSAQKSSAE